MLLPPIDQIIQAIASIASPVIKDKVQRNETVIKLLQQFKLDPEHPPSDFSGVYAYTLVEYGTGKPQNWLKIFRREEIKKSFRKAFDHNNPSILLSEVDAFLDTYAIEDEIRHLGLDVRREIAEFATVFIEVVKRSRTPADVLIGHQLGSLHKRIVGIQEQLSRLTNLEGIRTEIARLAVENYPALPDYAATKNNCKAISLAQQMRSWFETLGYRFEKYEVWQDSYFEWILNIPVRRNRYDRILIRGIAGEAGLGDVIALRQSLETQRADGGWLVTARRISRAARDEVKKNENRHLGCYTFDELLAEDADFSGYLDWLEAEVKRRKIDTKYVPLACNKEEIDPVTKRQIAFSHYDEQDGWIDGYIDRWLDDPTKEHISILGEFGTGKTWFALHYAWVTLQRYRDAQKRGTELPRLPLVISLRDYANAASVESLFSEFFFRQYKIPIPHYDAFVQLNRMGKLLLIFDGFDEMAAKVDQQEMINNFLELAKVVVPGAKVILTCRTEYFPEAKEGKALFNAELQASTVNFTDNQPKFEVLELEKFNNDQIQQVLSYFAETTIVKRIMRNPQLLDLARRPVMTELILEALPEIEADKPVDMSRVYLYAVRRKMERDIKEERTFTCLADKLYFLCELSWEMLSNKQMSLNYRLFPDRIRHLFSSIVQEQKNLDHWHHDMMGQTILIRNVDGDYTPAHRSLLEFFIAYKFAAELGVLASDFTELAQKPSCLNEGENSENHTWSSYFSRQLDEAENCFQIPALRIFRREPLKKLRENFGRVLLTKAVMDLLLPMIDIEAKETIIELIENTRGKSEEEVGYVGGNAATLLVKLDKVGLRNRDLSRTVILGADFTNASLCGVNFTEANLANSVFTKILGAVWAVAFSPDGKLFATGGSKGIVSLWETASGREILTYKGHTNWIRSIAFSPDGATLASGSADHTVRLWDINTGECCDSFEGHTSLVTSVAFSPNGAMLASGSDDHTIRLWDVNSGKECREPLQGHTSWVRSIAFSPNGAMLASGSEDRTIRLWDVNNGKECREPLQGHTSWVHFVAFRPDGAMLASGSADHTIRLWDINTGKYRILEGHTNWVTSVAFSPDGVTLASGSQDHTVRLWDINTGECRNTLWGHTSWVRSIAFSPDGVSVVSGSADHTVRLWDINTGECLNTLWGYINRVTSVAFSPDGATLASGSQDHTVRLWDVKSGKECREPLQGHVDSVTSVVFSPNRGMLASGSADHTVRLWDINTGKCLYILQEHTNVVYSIAFSPDGATLASGSEDHTVRLWDVSSGKYRNTLQGHLSWVYSIAFSPDGATLASGSHDKTLRLWDIKSGKCYNILEGHTNRVYSIAFSPDGATIASSSFDTTVRLWDVKSGKCCNILEGHTKSVNSVAFSPDGTIIASGSDDYTVRLWDVKSGKCCNIFEGHINGVTSVTFSPDGAIVAGGSIDCKVQLWHIKAEHIKTLEYERPYDRMNITGVTGLTEAEIASLKALGAVDTK